MLSGPDQWPRTAIAYFISRSMRALHGHPHAAELSRGYLAHLGVEGDVEGRKVVDLHRWTRRQTAGRLRQLIEGFEAHQVARRAAGKSNQRGDLLRVHPLPNEDQEKSSEQDSAA
jgi:hypothetical protein